MNKPLTKPESRQITQNAIRAGLLVKPSICQDCPSQFNIQAHHPDYNEPLKIEWLCHHCHVKRHSVKPNADKGISRPWLKKGFDPILRETIRHDASRLGIPIREYLRSVLYTKPQKP